LGIGDWGLGVGGLGPKPDPPTPKPTPPTPKNLCVLKKKNFFLFYKLKLYFITIHF